MSVKAATGTVDNLKRCDWCGTDALYMDYHDTEWGVPEYGEQALFERLVLEGMQAGLSWLTVLRKREHMRKRFFGFEVARVARASERSLTSWLNDAGLIRHRGKLEAMIKNARAVRSMDGKFSANLWQFVDGKPQTNRFRRRSQVPATTPTATAMAKWLKQEGFGFVGPTTCYALMQSAGMVNDHMLGCYRHAECEALD